ncbi:acyl-CoA dehydrogenase [uncultured Mycolicibacterium sp.]|uniref:acyl-CoA dehydrogenase family protein n=1 Tax=uncultured Mycolicibacterium sp. TaxID=2320817 RepID=UPI002637AD3E|nr:acyl-CoA dehydrogenase [uncultured Mycolicibacterium sp.]
MDFNLTDEQELLRDTTREVLSRTYDIETRNRVVEAEPGFTRQVWEQLAGIGILGLGFDPAEAGPIEVMLVQTEVGRTLAPEPIAQAALIPGALVAEAGSDAQRALLDEVAAGSRLLAFAHTEPGRRDPLAPPATTAARTADGWVLTGRKHPVPAGDAADTLLVTAALPDGGAGIFVVDAAAARRTPFRTFDGHRGAQIDLDATPAEPLGAGGDATAHIERTVIRFQSALCAEAVGVMEQALRITTEYLNTRKQFGVPLKTFQALTQRAADMYVSLELARSMSLYAAMSIADGRFDPVVAARAKLQIGRSGRHIAQESIQMHGGIGVTAEYPISHYAARLTAIEQTLGSSHDQLHVLIGQLRAYDRVSL